MIFISPTSTYQVIIPVRKMVFNLVIEGFLTSVYGVLAIVHLVSSD